MPCWHTGHESHFSTAYTWLSNQSGGLQGSPWASSTAGAAHAQHFSKMDGGHAVHFLFSKSLPAAPHRSPIWPWHFTGTSHTGCSFQLSLQINPRRKSGHVKKKKKKKPVIEHKGLPHRLSYILCGLRGLIWEIACNTKQDQEVLCGVKHMENRQRSFNDGASMTKMSDPEMLSVTRVGSWCLVIMYETWS